jgi:hypothetical protein
VVQVLPNEHMRLRRPPLPLTFLVSVDRGAGFDRAPWAVTQWTARWTGMSPGDCGPASGPGHSTCG